METKLLTTQEVADYFGVHKNVVTKKFCREGLKYIRLSQTDFRYNKKDILDFEEKMKVSNNINDIVQFSKFDLSTKGKLRV